MYDKVVAEFLSGNASFDAIQFLLAPGWATSAPRTSSSHSTNMSRSGACPSMTSTRPTSATTATGPTRASSEFLRLRHPDGPYPPVGLQEDRHRGRPGQFHRTYDDMIRIAPELNKAEPGVSAIGMMCGRGFWATYTWQHIAAQYGLQLFNENWEPVFQRRCRREGTREPSWRCPRMPSRASPPPIGRPTAPPGLATGGLQHLWQAALGTQATRADQSKIGDDVLTIYEPRVAGGVFAPPNIAGSTSCVTATSPEPEAAFLMLAYLTTASIMAMNEANAIGVAPGYKSVLTNPKLQAVSQPAKVGPRNSTSPGARRACSRASRSTRRSASSSTRSWSAKCSPRPRLTKPPSRSRRS